MKQSCRVACERKGIITRRKEEWLAHCVAPRPGCVLVTLDTLEKVLAGPASAVINKTEHL